MAELNENRVREIVRDEMSSLHIPERLIAIETKLDQKADKVDLEKVIMQITTLQTDVSSLKTGQRSLRDEMQNNFKFIIGFFITILALLIGMALK